jgi:hypothetical protein
MKDLFNHIITEDSRAEKYLELINRIGIQKTAEAVGGIKNLFKILGRDKDIVMEYLLSFFDDLKIGKFRNDLHLVQGPFAFLEKTSPFWGGNIKVYDDYLSIILKYVPVEIYQEYRRDLLKELISRYPEFNDGSEVIVYADRGLYKKLDRFYVNEEEVIKEEMENIDKKILNFLMRRIKVETRKLGGNWRGNWDDFEPLEVTEYTFEGYPGFGFTSYVTKTDMEKRIILLLIEAEIIDEDDFYQNTNRLNQKRQTIVKTVRKFLNQILSNT